MEMNIDLVKERGKSLRALRDAQRPLISATKLAENIGVTKSAVSEWERGKSQPGTDNLSKLDEALGGTGAVYEIYGLNRSGEPSNTQLLAGIEALTALCMSMNDVLEQIPALTAQVLDRLPPASPTRAQPNARARPAR